VTLFGFDGFWKCARCPAEISDPHEGPFGETLCAECCSVCSSGATRSWLEDQIKNTNTPFTLDDPIVGHGAPTREQMAQAEGWSP